MLGKQHVDVHCKDFWQQPKELDEDGPVFLLRPHLEEPVDDPHRVLLHHLLDPVLVSVRVREDRLPEDAGD
jgi:hypothetical protein